MVLCSTCFVKLLRSFVKHVVIFVLLVNQLKFCIFNFIFSILLKPTIIVLCFTLRQRRNTKHKALVFYMFCETALQFCETHGYYCFSVITENTKIATSFTKLVVKIPEI